MNSPDELTKLPEGGTFTLKTDTRVDGSDLDRFETAGGKIIPAGYKLFIDAPNSLGGDQTVIEKTPHGHATTIFGKALTVPAGTTITGAHPDGNGGSGTGVILAPISKAPLKAGSVVYRVVEVDPPPDKYEPHTWKAAAVTIAKASTKQLKLSKPFPGLSRTLFDPSALGRVFFESPLQAIQHFLAERRLEIVSLDRKRKEAERAIAWAQIQEGVGR